MMNILVLAILSIVISYSAEKRKNKVLTVSNAVLFVFLSIFTILGSKNDVLVYACKNIIHNDAAYEVVHDAIINSTGLAEGVLSTYFIIQLISLAIAAGVAIRTFIKGYKSIRKHIIAYFKKIRKELAVFSNAHENIENQKENIYFNNNLYLYNGELLI